MAIVSVYINSKEYRLACDDGQEDQLIAFSQEVDDRVRLISQHAPQAAESTVLVMAALMLADELADAKRGQRQLQGHIHRLEEALEQSGGSQTMENEARLLQIEAAMAETLHEVAQRMETIAGQLESGN